MKIKDRIKLKVFNIILKKNYPESQIELVSVTNPKRIEVGCYSYGKLEVIAFNNNSILKIGRFCSIAENVKFIMDADHYLNHISTFPFKAKMLKTTEFEAITKGDIVVEDDVWVGYGAVILSGVHIGQGAVIAANTVVTKDVPPYAVVAGNPGVIMKYRFSKELIDELLKIDFSKLSYDVVKDHIKELYDECTAKEQISWLVK